MARNKIIDLNNLLFEQLENLIQAETDDEIKAQVNKSKAVSSIASNIVACANLSLRAKELQLEYGIEDSVVPQLGYDDKK